MDKCVLFKLDHFTKRSRKNNLKIFEITTYLWTPNLWIMKEPPKMKEKLVAFARFHDREAYIAGRVILSKPRETSQ